MQDDIQPAAPQSPSQPPGSADVADAGLKPQAEEAFNRLWASLFYSGRLKGKSVLICSADRLEGASTIACGLALAASTAAVARVALVDFNLRSPALHEMLSAPDRPGVAEVLLEDLAPEQAAHAVNDALDLYPVGCAEGRALDILRSKGLRAMLGELAQGYDAVLLDCAAVNHFPDAQILAAAAGEAVLVARTDFTPREAVAQAKKRIEAGGGKVVGLVLNLRSYPIPEFLYRRV